MLYPRPPTTPPGTLVLHASTKSPSAPCRPSPSELPLVLSHPRRVRYRQRHARGQRTSHRKPAHWEQLAKKIEQKPEYKRLLSRVLTLSAHFQATLDAEQRMQWLELEDALLDHSWFLHGEYFNAGRLLGLASASSPHEPNEPAALAGLESQATLLATLARLIQMLSNEAPRTGD